MGRYITWEDIADRYSILEKGKFSGSDEANSAYILYAENQLDSLLASSFTVPFSSNNTTAKDLSIDLAYCRMGNFKIEDRIKLKEEIMGTINMLKDGTMSMITNSGDVITTLGSTPTWSTTQAYHPVFGHGDEACFEVDSGLTYTEEQAREY